MNLHETQVEGIEAIDGVMYALISVRPPVTPGSYLLQAALGKTPPLIELKHFVTNQEETLLVVQANEDDPLSTQYVEAIATRIGKLLNNPNQSAEIARSKILL